MACKDENSGPWMYPHILLHLEGLLPVFQGHCIPASGLSLNQTTQFVESRMKAREEAEVQEVIWEPMPWQGISCTPDCPCCALNTGFPCVLLSRNAVCLVRVLLAAAPGPCSVGCFLTLFLPPFQESCSNVLSPSPYPFS